MDATEPTVLKPDAAESSEIEYSPYQENTQLARYIKNYPRSFTRNPSQPLIERPLTLSELTGPMALDERLGITGPDMAHLTPCRRELSGNISK